MTIDYKALAKRIDADATDLERNAGSYGRIQDLRTVVSLLEWMAGQEPIYAYEWDTYDGAVRRSFSPAPYNGREPTRTLMLFLHPAPQPQQRDGMSKIDEKANALHSEAMAKLDELGSHPAPQPKPERQPKCGCRSCLTLIEALSTFVICPVCGNKRCPKADDHRNACTGSNAPGQVPQPERQPASDPCIGNDPNCPCQDGDPCHYRDHGDTKAMPIPQPQPVSEQADNEADLVRIRDVMRKYGWQCRDCCEEILALFRPQQPERQPMSDDYIRGYDAGFLVGAEKGRSEPTEAQIDYRALYHELLFAVGNKHAGETRHETALRYIREAERSDGAALAAKE